MPDILHKIQIDAGRENVYEALSTIGGLAGWWTSTTSGESTPGGTIDFRFGEHVSHMKVEESEVGERVVWQCTGPNPAWVGTRLSFDLSGDEGRTTLNFGHRDWREADDFFAHCSMKWATFMLSLKSYVETGEGRPFPNDVGI